MSRAIIAWGRMPAGSRAFVQKQGTLWPRQFGGATLVSACASEHIGILTEHYSAMSNRAASFDLQAETYDQRVGLPEQDCQAIVRAVLALAQVQAGDVVLEVAAGTVLYWPRSVARHARRLSTASLGPQRYTAAASRWECAMAAGRCNCAGHLQLTRAALTGPRSRCTRKLARSTARWCGGYSGPGATPGQQCGSHDAAGDAAFAPPTRFL